MLNNSLWWNSHVYFCSADLPYSTSESRLLEKFSNFGDIAEGKSCFFLYMFIEHKAVIYLHSCYSISGYVNIHLLLVISLVVKLVQDETTGRSKGFAFIQFSSQDDAMLAIENMDYQVLLCVLLIVLILS